MPKLQKVVYGVILVAIIVVAGAYVVRKAGRGSPEPPKWYQDEPVELIDSVSMEVITKSRGEWESLGQSGQKCKNPGTGAFTMVKPITCGPCGAKIPMPDMPPLPKGEDLKARAEYSTQARNIMAAYKCPKCGKLASAAAPPR